MENKVVFIDGVNVFQPNEKAPDFVKASLVINRTQIKESKQGKLYASVDTFKPKPKAEGATVEATDDLPF